jgi:hypothetical protein
VKTARRQGEFPDHRAFLLTQRNEIKPAIKDALADTASATHLTKKRRIQMKQFISTVFLMVFSQLAIAGHHEGGLKLEQRQAPAVLGVTSVTLGEVTTINAMGDMGEYGRVYVTYNLTQNSPTSGTVTGEGRGVQNSEIVFGSFSGYYQRDGAVLTMRNVVQLSDGSQNLDVVTLEPAKGEARVEAYILK